MSLELIVQTYGYRALVIGTFFEGETILIIGGFAAHRGYLSLPLVIIAAFTGTLAGDQFFFFIGRKKDKAFLDKKAVEKGFCFNRFDIYEIPLDALREAVVNAMK